jgi:hypothetical protein
MLNYDNIMLSYMSALFIVDWLAWFILQQRATRNNARAVIDIHNKQLNQNEPNCSVQFSSVAGQSMATSKIFSTSYIAADIISSINKMMLVIDNGRNIQLQ